MTPSWLKQPQNSTSLVHSWSCNPLMKNCNQGLSDPFAVDQSKRYLTVSLGTVNHLSGEAFRGRTRSCRSRERQGSWQGHSNAAEEKGRAEEKEPCRARLSISWYQGGEHLLLAASAHQQDTWGLAGLTKRPCSPLQIEVNSGNWGCSS